METPEHKNIDQILEQWQRSGLLEGIESEDDKLNVALSLEATAMILLSETESHAYHTMMFPIVRRISQRNGYKPIRWNVELCKHVKEAFDNRDSSLNDEVEFCVEFCKEHHAKYA